MGSHMANNLMKAGYQLVIHDKNETIASLYYKRGAISANGPSEVAEASDAVITMLPSAAAVSEVYLGPNGLLSKRNGVRPSLLIDASTVDPQTCRRIVTSAEQCSLSETSRRIGSLNHPIMLDSPVSGGVIGAQAGTLTFMVGGIEEGCKAAKSLFEAMGQHVVYCGGSGNGAAAKICNNLALAVSMAGISEALALGQRLGIDAHVLSKIFNASTARCWSSDTYNPVPGVMEAVPASRGYTGGFSCQLMDSVAHVSQHRCL